MTLVFVPICANHGEVGHRKMGDFSIKNVPLHGVEAALLNCSDIK
jgi:hypothetical protein